MLNQDVGSFVVVAVLGGLGCSVDGVVAVLCQFASIRKIRDALMWGGAIMLFHWIFWSLAGALTVCGEANAVSIQLAVRVLGLAATGYFLWTTVGEASESKSESASVGPSTAEFWWTAAIVGSIDAFSFGHGCTLHLRGSTVSALLVNWTISALVVGIFTCAAGLTVIVAASFLKRSKRNLVALGVAVRAGLFAALALSLTFLLLERFEYYAPSKSVTHGWLVASFVLFAIPLFVKARRLPSSDTVLG